MINEGTHGVQASGDTMFPEGLAIGSTWNKNLVRDIYSTVAEEARSTGTDHFCTLVIEPNRDPRMGRNCEGYSEDTYMCSSFAKAMLRVFRAMILLLRIKLLLFYAITRARPNR